MEDLEPNIYFIKEPGELADEAIRKISRWYSYGVDTETTGLDPFTSKVLLLQIGNEDFQFVFSIQELPTGMIDKLRVILEHPGTDKILHNAKFDYKMLKHHYNILLSNVKDTMILEQLNRAGQPTAKFALSTLMEKYQRIDMLKTTRKYFINKKDLDFSQEEIEYAANDVKYLKQLYGTIFRATLKKGLEKLGELECNTTLVTGDLELNGIFLNSVQWQALEDQACRDIENLKVGLDVFFAPYCDINEINYNSPQQVAPILSLVIGENIGSTDKRKLMGINHEAAKLLIEYREAFKKTSTYGMEFLNNIHPTTDRIHCNYNQLRADSGRYSSSEPNMQQIPNLPEYRAAFTAPKNQKVITADYKSIELVILAELSQDEKFVRALEEGRDLHKMVASVLYDKPEDQITKEERKFGKGLNFGTVYGTTAYGLSKRLGVTPKQGQALLAKFYSEFGGVKRFLEQMEERARQTGIAYSPLDKRQRTLSFDWDYEKEARHALNIARNQPFQGCCATILKQAMVNLRKSIDSEYLPLTLNATVHDEIVCYADEDSVEDCQQAIEKAMLSAATDYIKTVPVGVDVSVGDYWIK